ncbi:MAG: CCA tRNA nucleotidyltransferase [Candidatus Bathyarchaeota archaeon]|nr:CCA tRNA nucleotidyltransferase [Candidatus Bathyarchaeum tardum]WGM89779.1 MAG: CCA tRNA nucleotidyltransferase [Candidatus Bathyarchaeum tardum]WNZ30125.1 MAG: CCA tRNA nucleotidyltransferase [Candidatus Bathyarchaeota archaeon]
MPRSVEEIRWEVLKLVNPSESDQKKIQAIAESLTKKVENAAKNKGVDIEVRIEGSVAKNTWLKDCPEIDVFMQVAETVPLEDFGTVLLDVAKEATKDFVQIERYAQHPYIEAVTDDGVYLNVVPCYKVKQGNLISATDRTPFHTDYVKAHLTKKMSEEIRLLKRFMKGINVYGAEIKVGGFSGYLCELLVLNFGSFIEVLRAATDWKEKTVIDNEKQYKQLKALKEKFVEPLVVVDPVDKQRNVAAAVRPEKLDEFIAASREFLKKPDIKFFYPPKTKALTQTELLESIRNRGSSLVFIKFKGKIPVPDVLWGQLYKRQKAIRKIITQNDFEVLRDAIWSDEKSLNVFVFELQNRLIPNMKAQLGPPLNRKNESEKFLRKHLGSDLTVSGPRTEDSRWIVDVKRNYTDVIDLLNDKLRHGFKGEGVADIVAEAVDCLEVLLNDEIASFYCRNSDFAGFLTQFLDGKPLWLS